jgi:single-stranded-DNA-specific exonuclease
MPRMVTRADRWACRPYSVIAADRISTELGLSPTTAGVLVRRGYETVKSARAFLAADERHDPLLMPGATKACELVLRHVECGSRIVVHGDYDVDGVCSTSILVRALRALGAEPSWHLPSRLDDGYGLSLGTVERLAAAGAELLITADCGITAPDEVAAARARGIDVLVTDHHRPGRRLPECPIVHPGLGGYPSPDLCAAGVAHKLVEAVHARAGLDPSLAREDLDLVALATICDLVPLRGENRRLAREGLRALARTSKPGLRALMGVAALEPGAVDEHAVGFRLGPRLNAAGRLRRADAALELLLTEDERRAAEVAEELDLLNRERREAETRILIAAEAACVEQASAAALVLAGEGWNPGVVGIVASRLVERHNRPCILIALDGEGGRGSGRSTPAYDLHAGLAACAGHLHRFGGHPAAAGLEIEADRVEPFRRALSAHAGALLTPHDLMPTERVDAIVPARALGMELAEELGRLAPFGAGNPKPTLLVPAARVGHVTAMGEERAHARFILSSGGSRARGVAFRVSPGSLAAAGREPHDVVVRLEANEWNGVTEPRVVLRALCPSAEGACKVLGGDEPFWVGVERELTVDPALWCQPPEAARRELRDRREDGFAGVAGDLLSSEERVLVVCADVPRRRSGVERLVAGLARGDAPPLGLISWDALALEPGHAEGFDHLIALDPPPLPVGQALLATAPCSGGVRLAHLAWGRAEADFALAVARAGLDLRGPLADAYRGLRESAGDGAELERALRGTTAHPRPPAVCGRLMRVLVELGLVDYRRLEEGGPGIRLLESARTDLERSPAYRAYALRLQEVERHLASVADLREPAVSGRRALA